jgi:TetR/AcrR family transcriptional regulator
VRRNFQRNFNIWRGDIRKILDKGGYQVDEKKARMLPYLMVSLMMGASMQYLIDEGSFDLDDYFTAAEMLILDAIHSK